MTKGLSILVLLAILAGCRSASSIPDIRERLLNASARQDPGFPDGEKVRLTHFAYIGKVQSLNEPLYVVYQRTVIPNMPAPRGHKAVVLYNSEGRFLRRISVDTEPLWCEGNKIFFFGFQPAPFPSPISEDPGNAWDLKSGIDSIQSVTEVSPGSYTPTR